MVETFSSDRVAFRTPSNINTPLRKQPTALACRLLPQKKPHHRLSNVHLTGGTGMWGVGGLEVHGIRGHRLVYNKKEVKFLKYKK